MIRRLRWQSISGTHRIKKEDIELPDTRVKYMDVIILVLVGIGRCISKNHHSSTF